MADQFDAFRKEVDEDLQREKFAALWKQYGTYILAAAAGIVVLVAGWKYVEARRIAAAEAQAANYVAAVKALGDGKDAATAAAVEAIGKGTDGYAVLARVRLAAADAAAGRTDKALAAYEALARDTRIDRLIADYARLQTAMLKVDSADWTDIQNRLTDLTSDTNPWRHSARELLGLAALKAGRPADARTQFERLVADQSAPRSISERAATALAEIAVGELAKAQPAPATPKETPQGEVPKKK